MVKGALNENVIAVMERLADFGKRIYDEKVDGWSICTRNPEGGRSGILEQEGVLEEGKRRNDTYI